MKTFNRIFASLLIICLLSVNGCNSSETNSSDLNTTSLNNSSVSADNTTSNNESSTSSLESNIVNNSSQEQTTNSSTPEPEIDANAPTIFLTTEKNNNNTITLNVNIKNNPCIAAYTMRINYDQQQVTPKTITKGLTSVTSNLQQPNTPLQGFVTAVYVETAGMSEDGVLFSITFDMNSPNITTEFTIGTSSFTKPDYSSVNFQKQNITIKNKSCAS